MLIKNYDQWASGSYSEISQVNPIRWMNLRSINLDKGEFEAVSHWWKCKDFMNEVVTSKWLNKPFSIYGFSVSPETFFNPEDKGLFLLVKGLLSSFTENLKVLNVYLQSQGFPSVLHTPYKDKQVIYLPSIYLDNTFFISTITLLIRLCNTNVAYTSLDDMVKDGSNSGDSENYAATKKKPLGKFPQKLEPYIWYYSPDNCLKKTDKDKSFSNSMMHNCGVVSWGWF